MSTDSDVFHVLGWGLRRYAWLILLVTVGLALGTPVLLTGGTDQYEAQAQVGPSGPLNVPNMDTLPRLGETVFNNGAVAETIRESFDPPLPDSTSVIPERVELVAAQDNIIFTVIGRAPTPEGAQDSANLGASTLTEELNKYAEAVGVFAVQRLADRPAEPVPELGGQVALGIGALAGLICGLGLVVALLAWKRPIVDTTGAASVTGVPAFASIRLAPGRYGVRGLPQLCHRVITERPVQLLLTGPASTRYEQRQLALELATVLERTRPVRLLRASDLSRLNQDWPGPAPTNGHGAPELLITDGARQIDIAIRPPGSMTLLVVREGIGHSALSRLAAERLDPGSTGVILVRSPRWHPRMWWRRMHSSHATSDRPGTRPKPAFDTPAEASSPPSTDPASTERAS